MGHMPTYEIEVEIFKRRALEMHGRIIIEIRPTIKTSNLKIWIISNWLRMRSSGGLLSSNTIMDLKSHKW
jgi:hypothetical protein